MVSIIVPVYNEELLLKRRAADFCRLGREAELIFSDGGSVDGSAAAAALCGRVVSTGKGRARQMNAGAAQAGGDILLFLHADAMIAAAALPDVMAVCRKPEVAGGCFRQRLDESGWRYRWIAWTGNLRAAMTGICYGDQGIFLRRDVFQSLGGFPDVPICEDVLLSRRLRAVGRICVLPHHVTCSARRWKTQGILKTFWMNQRVYRALRRGEDLAAVARTYHDVREEASHETQVMVDRGDTVVVAGKGS